MMSTRVNIPYNNPTIDATRVGDYDGFRFRTKRAYINNGIFEYPKTVLTTANDEPAWRHRRDILCGRTVQTENAAQQ